MGARVEFLVTNDEGENYIRKVVENTQKSFMCKIDLQKVLKLPYRVITINTLGNAGAWGAIAWRIGAHGHKKSVLIKDRDGLVKTITWDLIKSFDKKRIHNEIKKQRNNQPQQMYLLPSP